MVWAKTEVIYLSIGETYKVKTQPLSTLRVQKKGLLQIKDEGQWLIISGKKLGTTRLQVGTQHFQFVVIKKLSKETLTQLQAWLRGKRGPTLEVINNQPVIGGHFLRWQDLLDLLQYTHNKSDFMVTSTLEPNITTQLSDWIKTGLIKNNLHPGELSLQPQWRYRISEAEKNNLSHYKKILSPLGIAVEVDKNSLNQKPMIKLQVYIAHIKKNFLRQWGLRWPGEFKAQMIPQQGLSLQNLDISLQALESKGQGQMLATPTLLTESGSLAEFHSGGELPIRTTTQFNNNVQWKRYGLFLRSTPTANSQKNLKIEINIELSALDQSHAQGNLPALIRSQVSTQVNMKTPQPILLSGFLQQQQGQSRSGLPWLQQIPVFSPLFSEGQIYNNDYELVFILIPSFYND